MRIAIDAIFAFLLMGLVEAVIKPIAKKFVQGRILRYAPEVFKRIDPLMPSILTEFNGKEMDDIVRAVFEKVTGESWANVDLTPFWTLYDPRRAADKLNGQQQDSPA